MTPNLFQYSATVVSVHDGDTLDLEIDFGFKISQTQTVRLFGINAPELKEPLGPKATIALTTFVSVGDTVFVQTIKDKTEKFGRLLAKIYTVTLDSKSKIDTVDDNCINKQLLDMNIGYVEFMLPKNYIW